MVMLGLQTITRIYVKCGGEWVKCTDLAHGDSKAPERHYPRQGTGTGLPTSTISCAGTQELRPTHTAPNRSKLGPTSSDFLPHVSLARQHDHRLFLKSCPGCFTFSVIHRSGPILEKSCGRGISECYGHWSTTRGTQNTHTRHRQLYSLQTNPHLPQDPQHTETIANESQTH